MNTPLKFLFRVSGVAAAVVCLTGLPVMAADASSTSASAESAPELPLIDLDLVPDTTVAEVIGDLKKRYPMYGFVLGPGVAKVTLGEMKLRRVSLSDFAMAIRLASGERLQVTDPSGDSLYMILNPGPAERRIQAYNLLSYLRSLGNGEIDDYVKELQARILAALASVKGVKELDGRERPDFQFFPQGGVFIVIGSPDAIGVSSTIIGALSTPERQAAPGAKPSSPQNSH